MIAHQLDSDDVAAHFLIVSIVFIVEDGVLSAYCCSSVLLSFNGWRDPLLKMKITLGFSP